MNLLRKIQYCQYWNIGFCEQTPEDLLRDKVLKPVRWLHHPYRDRWFADPFILKVTDDEIVVFVEECPIDNPKGIICELVINRRTMQLKKRYVLLEKDTHLSYPAIIRHDGKVYVYPENGASGKLNIYEYDEEKHCLVNPVCILDAAVADATITCSNGMYFLTATKFPDTQKNMFLYKADNLFGPFKQVFELPVQESSTCSRNGGDFFTAFGTLCRSSQDCSSRYGGALTIMYVDLLSGYKESMLFGIRPFNGRFQLGLHTLNFRKGIAVVDSYGYYFPVLGMMYYRLRTLIGKKS